MSVQNSLLRIVYSETYSVFLYTGKQDAPTYAYQMVRTDSKEQKLEAFFGPGSTQRPAHNQLKSLHASTSQAQSESGSHSSSEQKKRSSSGSVSSVMRPFKKRAHRKEVRLTSVRSLQLSVRKEEHTGAYIV